MKATILHNTERDSIEIRFPAKPTSEVLSGLKDLSFRWYGKEAFWYAKHTLDLMRQVQTLLGSEVAADASFTPRERTERTTNAPASSLPFLQHLAAFAKYKELTTPDPDDKYRDLMHTSSGKTVAVNVFLDSAGNVILQRIAKRWKNFNTWGEPGQVLEPEEIQQWFQVAKSGKVEGITPGKLKYDWGGDLYHFGGQIYGVDYGTKLTARHDPKGANWQGWYQPAKREGSVKDMVNGTILEANKRELTAAGFEINLTGRRLLFRPTATSPQPRKITPDGEGDYTPFVLPSRCLVPSQWRKPYFELPVIDDYKSRTKVRADLVEIELLLGKMEVAKYKYFDGMQDMWEYTGKDKLVWYTPTDGMPDRSFRDSPSHTGQNQVTWGSYYLRYNGKSAPAYLNLGTGQPDGVVPTAAEQVATGKAAPAKPADSGALAARFIKVADSQQAESDRKYRELNGAQSNTPKRLREYNSKQIDADIAADKARYYRAIGEAIKGGTLPDLLKGIGPTLKDDHLYLFVAGHAGGGGYYDAYRATYPKFEQYKDRKADITSQAKRVGLLSYEQVEEAYNALQALVGGKTSFDPNAAKLKKLIDSWRFSKQPGFFPTPKDIAEQMVRSANIQPGNTVLEPSAGLGDIAEVIRDNFPGNSLTVCERMVSLREILELKGFKLAPESDFLAHKGRYNRIIMNPPFENGQDIDHVRHAHDLLLPGGWVVALMSEGPFYRTDKKATAFRDWLEGREHYTQKLPDGSFKNAFNSTGVAIRMVIIEKEGLERRVVTPQSIARKDLLRKRATGITTAKAGKVVNTMQTSVKRAEVIQTKATQTLLLRARALKLKLALLNL